MLIQCPECGNNVSNKAISCPLCGYPINLLYTPQNLTQQEISKSKPKRKKYKKLPNGFGSIKKLSGNRKNPYAAYPKAIGFNYNGSPILPPAIGYYKDWHTAYEALKEYNKNPYELDKKFITFKEVYDLYFQDKYIKNQKKKFSNASINSTKVAYNNCSPIHNKIFRELRKSDMQRIIDECPLKHSSLELIITLFKQMYKYAIQNDIVDKDYSQFVTINIPDDDESGEPFSDEELQTLWKNKDDPTVGIILMMIYSGFRIKAFETIEINLEEHYFLGGVKTQAGKNRIVPIHNDIYEFSKIFTESNFNSMRFRRYNFYPTLKKLGIEYTKNGKKHTPHDCRHTFSCLCDKYGVNDFSKHLLMGHSIGNDTEKSVYGHRTIEELRQEISKIKVEICC